MVKDHEHAIAIIIKQHRLHKIQGSTKNAPLATVG